MLPYRFGALHSCNPVTFPSHLLFAFYRLPHAQCPGLNKILVLFSQILNFARMKPFIILKITLSIILIFALSVISCTRQPKWTETAGPGNIRIITNPEGQTLGYSTTSGVKILTVKGFAFKDLNRNGKLDKYEDWRFSANERAKDLASQMTIEQIAGLMLYSAHQAIPAGSRGWFTSTYGGKQYEESGAAASDLPDHQC
jgi:beta-glucosidase